MTYQDWRPSLSPQLLKKIRERKKAEEAKAKKTRGVRRSQYSELQDLKKLKTMVPKEAKERIDSLKGTPDESMSVKDIIEMVAANHNMTYDQLITLKFRKNVAARYDAIETVKLLKPHLSSTQLGKFFNRDHTTILYALGRVKGGKGKKS